MVAQAGRQSANHSSQPQNHGHLATRNDPCWNAETLDLHLRSFVNSSFEEPAETCPPRRATHG